MARFWLVVSGVGSLVGFGRTLADDVTHTPVLYVSLEQIQIQIAEAPDLLEEMSVRFLRSQLCPRPSCHSARMSVYSCYVVLPFTFRCPCGVVWYLLILAAD